MKTTAAISLKKTLGSDHPRVFALCTNMEH